MREMVNNLLISLGLRKPKTLEETIEEYTERLLEEMCRKTAAYVRSQRD